MDYDGRYARPPVTSARPGPRPIMVVQVLRGDTIESVADRYHVSEQAIIDANDLQAPYRLRPGQSLTLPPSSVHIVASGDTVNSIARIYGVSPFAIIDVNQLAAPDAIHPGERLTIPFVGPHQMARVERVPATVTRSDLAAPNSAPPAATASAASTGEDPRLAGARYYTAGLPRHKPETEGEGGPEFSNARAAHAVDPVDEAYQPRHKPAVPKADVASDDPADDAYDSPRRVQVRDQQVAAVDPADDAYDPQRRAKPAAPNAEVKASNHFVWPVRGQIISTFGRRASGVHNDGVNIAAEPGSSVKAADAGVVVYAGNELPGYGNLLLIRHSNGFVTAYAHNKTLLVSKGDNVRQGQTIAIVGSTGDVDRPQLHFEIRKGDRAVDPARYLETANAGL